MTRIGALLNIDPGQSREQIDRSFQRMKSCGMDICRIVMNAFRGQGNAQDLFEQYDSAFDSAENLGMGVVVTLSGDEDGFREIISRYKGRKALEAWDVEGKKQVEIVKESDSDHGIISGGLSLLPGIHFAGFPPRRFEVALSAACDIARSRSGENPFWVTGLQGGSNIYSGRRCFSPSSAEITQWLWTAVASGSEGVFIQSVNSKREGHGAGEMSLLNMQGGMTERSEAVKNVISVLGENSDIFRNAKPVFAPVTMIYTRESIQAEAKFHRDDLPDCDYEVRQKGGSMKDAVAVYQILMERGIRADFREISEYPWEQDSRCRCIVFAGQSSVPMKYYPMIREFVKKGGKVIIEGLSFCYDEHMNSVFSAEFPLKDVFGGYVEEYNSRPGCYRISIDGKNYWTHLFDGIIHNEASGESLRILRNKYGRGSVTWVPSVIGMGSMQSGHKSRISKFFKKELEEIVKDLPICFRRRYTGIALQLLETPENYITIVTSNKRHRRKVVFRTGMRVQKCLFANEVDYKTGKARNHKVKVHSGQTVVALWKKK